MCVNKIVLRSELPLDV